MEDHLDALHERPAECWISHVAGNHLDILQSGDVLEPAPAIEAVILRQRANFIVLLEQMFDEVRTYESIATGYQSLHQRPSTISTAAAAAPLQPPSTLRIAAATRSISPADSPRPLGR